MEDNERTLQEVTLETCPTNSKGLEALLETNDRDFFKGLRVFKLETQPGKNPEMIREGGKVTSTFLRMVSPAFLASGLVQDAY